MKKQKENAYTKGIFSSLIILFLLAVLTVFPNLWDNLAYAFNPIAFKLVPFIVLIAAVCLIFCLYEGIGFLFYTERKGEKTGFTASFRFFLPKRFFRLVRLYSTVYLIKLILSVMIFLPTAIVFFCAFLFYKNGCPVISVGIMSACAVVTLINSVMFYGEISSLFFLSRYLFFENESGSIREILKESFEKMKGKGGKIRNIRQSFFLPLLSCIFLIPIPFVLTDYKYALSKKAYELMREK